MFRFTICEYITRRKKKRKTAPARSVCVYKYTGGREIRAILVGYGALSSYGQEGYGDTIQTDDLQALCSSQDLPAGMKKEREIEELYKIYQARKLNSRLLPGKTLSGVL